MILEVTCSPSNEKFSPQQKATILQLSYFRPFVWIFYIRPNNSSIISQRTQIILIMLGICKLIFHLSLNRRHTFIIYDYVLFPTFCITCSYIYGRLPMVTVALFKTPAVFKSPWNLHVLANVHVLVNENRPTTPAGNRLYKWSCSNQLEKKQGAKVRGPLTVLLELVLLFITFILSPMGFDLERALEA